MDAESRRFPDRSCRSHRVGTALTLVQKSRADETRQWQFAADQLQIDALLPLLVHHPALSVDQRSILQKTQATGILRDVRVDAATRTDGALDSADLSSAT